jgi:hypothetical protein
VRLLGIVYGATDGVNDTDPGVYVPNGVVIGWVIVAIENDSIGKMPIRLRATIEQNCTSFMNTSLKRLRNCYSTILIIYLKEIPFQGGLNKSVFWQRTVRVVKNTP